jgi:flagellar basal-body rod protein FlgG
MLGSGMLTQTRVLSTISNNIANVETTGYKTQNMSTSTFGSMMIASIGSQTKELGSVSLMCVADELSTVHTQGTLTQTERNLDFAIEGEGFFGIQSDRGTIYTRNGNFNIDDEGYLVLDEVGMVLGQDGAPILLSTDSFTADSQGNLTVDGAGIDSIAVYNLEDYNTLEVAEQDCYRATTEQLGVMESPTILWKTLEGSNVDASQEMTEAISAQRNLQSCSQAIQTYYETLDKAITEIAKI